MSTFADADKATLSTTDAAPANKPGVFKSTKVSCFLKKSLAAVVRHRSGN